MNIRYKSLSVFFIGLVLMALGFYVPGNPRAPLSLGGIPLPFFTGIGAGYTIGGGLAYLVEVRRKPLTIGTLLYASMLSIPLALIGSILIQNIESGGIPSIGPFLAFHVGLAVLFYPIAFGFVFGFAPEPRDRPVLLVLSAILLVGVLVAAIIRPEGLGAAVFFVGFWVVLIVDLLFAYPLYRMGLELKPQSKPQ